MADADRVVQPCRLLWVNHFAVTPAEGGGTRHAELGRELVSLGWEVTVAAADYHYQSRQYIRRAGSRDKRPIREIVSGVEFQWLWSAPYRSNNWRRAWNWLSFGRSLLQSHIQQPSVVIGSSPHLFAAAAAARLADRWRVPFVLEVRDLWPESLLAAGGRKGLAYYIFERLASWLYRRADLIVCLARGSVDRLQERGIPAARLLYVPNGVDPAAFARVDHPLDDFVLVYAGAHGPANGLDVVLEAADRLRDLSSVRFLLIGDGPSKLQLMAMAADRGLVNVEFRDPVPKAEIGAIFEHASAGLMVLRDDPLFAYGVSPNKLFDYLGAQLPVVSNVPGDVAHMLVQANAGIQTRDSSASALEAAVRAMVATPDEERAAMGKRGREWVIREHGRPGLAEKLDSALRQLAGAC